MFYFDDSSRAALHEDAKAVFDPPHAPAAPPSSVAAGEGPSGATPPSPEQP
jgi:hypothetical protein